MEKLAEALDTETNYLGQCERGERRFSLDKLADLIEYFGITANDIIPPPSAKRQARENSVYLRQINELLAGCTERINWPRRCICCKPPCLFLKE